ncbi:hypothetical protein ABIA06_003046 [Bradyrhizobium yuanmingense]|uniref:hypothetical protein n=1 Tax=Bradyrhizobium yuanmingense TaxID=108015 RepID=UPI003512F3F0
MPESKPGGTIIALARQGGVISRGSDKAGSYASWHVNCWEDGQEAAGLGALPSTPQEFQTWIDPACHKCDHTFMLKHAPHAPINPEIQCGKRGSMPPQPIGCFAGQSQWRLQQLYLGQASGRSSLGNYRVQSHGLDINCDSFENAVQRGPNHLALVMRGPSE